MFRVNGLGQVYGGSYYGNGATLTGVVAKAGDTMTGPLTLATSSLTVDWHGDHQSGTAGLSGMPEVGIYESPELNAFATGPTRSRALVAVSTGLLGSMSRGELEGVLAHELSHVANGDMVTMTLVQGVVNAFVMFLARVIAFAVAQSMERDNRRTVQFLVTIVLEIALSLLGMIAVAWFSRRREFRADAGGAKLAGTGSMVAALEALRRRYEPLDNQPAYASLKIAGGRTGFMALISTHPPLEDRIAALKGVTRV